MQNEGRRVAPPPWPGLAPSLAWPAIRWPRGSDRACPQSRRRKNDMKKLRAAESSSFLSPHITQLVWFVVPPHSSKPSHSHRTRSSGGRVLFVVLFCCGASPTAAGGSSLCASRPCSARPSHSSRTPAFNCSAAIMQQQQQQQPYLSGLARHPAIGPHCPASLPAVATSDDAANIADLSEDAETFLHAHKKARKGELDGGGSTICFAKHQG